MSSNPCQICGCTDLNLVDGFYYCVECGTQDVNVRETVVEQTMLGDGTHLIGSKKKLCTVLKDAVLEMSGEWHKWHAYNFILAGLTEELIALGAKPTVKTMVMWVWLRYIKKFQKKDDAVATQFENKRINEENKSLELSDEDRDDSDDISEINLTGITEKKKKKKKKKDYEKYRRDITIVTKGMLLTILHVALNLDKSDIQITHLFRFIREGRLSIYNCLKFVPKELCVKLIPYWMNFIRCQNEYTPRVIRAYGMTIFKRLELGVPLVPDLNKLIDSYIQELCLPRDFKDLVFSLINLMPCNFLQLDVTSLKHLVRVPDYEGVCMSYVLLALKMCFGLDCDYEIRLSDEVDKINCNEDYLRSYKIGTYSVPTDRLFSFREWYMFLQFRKIILSRYYLPMARQYNLPADDCVFMEHLEERSKRKIRLSDDVTMDILNKMPIEDTGVIPKSKFVSTLTPMTTYTEVILDYIHDPELKLRLSEDFSQYSLKYATKYLDLPSLDNYTNNLVKGVGEVNKVLNPIIIGTLISKKGDCTMVLVRNCENKNWLKTKPPNIQHVTKGNTNIKSNDKDSDHGYDSSIELTSVEKDESEIKAIEDDLESEVISDFEEEDERVIIFDDNFQNLQIVDDDKKGTSRLEEIDTNRSQNFCNLYDSKLDIQDTFTESSAGAEGPRFNIESLDRQKIIEQLIELTCKEYKIPLPKPKQTRETVKRKYLVSNETGQSQPKKRKSDINTGQRPKGNTELSKGLVNAYYENIDNDVFTKISEHVISVIEMSQARAQVDDPYITNEAPPETELENLQRTNDSYLHTLDSSQNSVANDSSIHGITLNGTIDDEASIEDLICKSDPKFDAKTHDINQLYIKLNDKLNVNNFMSIESDPELDEIIDKKILEFNGANIEKEHTDDISDTSDSEDEVPLSVLRDEKLSYMTKKHRQNFEYLIDNSKLKQFGYWMKHYKTKGFTRHLDMNQKFNIELMENHPISFVFVIRECATIVNCTTFCLYKCIQSLEERLSCYVRK